MHMQELGFSQAFVDQVGNAVGVMGEGEHQIVLLGHIDTVPGEIPVEIVQTGEGTRIYGRGAVDAKGPLAAFVDASASLGPLPGLQVLIIGAVEEERDSAGARHIRDQYQPSFAIIGEPSQWNRVTLGYKGSAWAEVVVRRTMTHTAGRVESAPETAVVLWNRIMDWAVDYNLGRERIFDQVTPTLGGFSSEEDSFYQTARLQIGCRLPLDLAPEDWYGQLQHLVYGKAAEVHLNGYPIPAYRCDRKTPLVRAFLGGIRSAGGKPGFVVKTGTADLNIVAPAWGCPAVAYGPGDSALDHTPAEHLLLEHYHQAVVVLQEVLHRLAAQA
jgi:LysW-gamma-L-lysine carboxypeptidase